LEDVSSIRNLRTRHAVVARDPPLTLREEHRQRVFENRVIEEDIWTKEG
jgi:hypothetical protein